MTLTRREFVKKSSLTLAFSLAGNQLLLTPAEAREKAIPFTTLSAEEVSTLEAVCEIMLPGATESGVAHFVDHQLGVDPNDSLVFIKYFNYPPPYDEFYRAILAQLKALSMRQHKKEISKLSDTEAKKFVESIRDGNPEGWQGPPAPLAYHALRNDAVDVVYGTPEGFKKLGVPYMEHILPPEGWS